METFYVTIRLKNVGEKFMNLKLKSKILMTAFCVSKLLSAPLNTPTICAADSEIKQLADTSFARFSFEETSAYTRTASHINWNRELFKAIEDNNVSLALKCLDRGVNPNTVVRSSGETPLHLTAEKNAVEICKYLLAYGANPNLKNIYNGYTPLHIAATYGHSDITLILLKAGADPNAQSLILRSTPLHLANPTKDELIIKYLVEYNANIYIQNIYGISASTNIPWKLYKAIRNPGAIARLRKNRTIQPLQQ